jgi:hypothetical protein
MFKSKQPPVTINDLLGNDAVKKITEDFLNNYMSRTKGVIIICDINGDCEFISGGVSQGEAVLMLDIAHHQAVKDLLR